MFPCPHNRLPKRDIDVGLILMVASAVVRQAQHPRPPPLSPYYHAVFAISLMSCLICLAGGVRRSRASGAGQRAAGGQGGGAQGGACAGSTEGESLVNTPTRT